MERNGDNMDHDHRRRRSRSGSVNVGVNVNVAVNVNAVNGGHSHGTTLTATEHKPATKAEEGDAPDSKGTIMEVEEAAEDDNADTKLKVEEALTEALPVVEGVLGDDETSRRKDEDRKELEQRQAEEMDMKEGGTPHDRGDEMVLETEEDTVLF